MWQLHVHLTAGHLLSSITKELKLELELDVASTGAWAAGPAAKLSERH